MAYAPQSAIPWMANAYPRPKAGLSPSFGETFVGRMQYAPTQRHKNAPRFMHTTTVKQSNAPRFTHSIARNVPTATQLRHAPMWDGESGKTLCLVTSEKS